MRISEVGARIDGALDVDLEVLQRHLPLGRLGLQMSGPYSARFDGGVARQQNCAFSSEVVVRMAHGFLSSIRSANLAVRVAGGRGSRKNWLQQLSHVAGWM